MNLPFTPHQFFEVFGKYNEAVWPLQTLFDAAAILVLFLIYQHHPKSGGFTAAILAFFWAWMGIMYHLRFFSDINPAAFVFGLLFIIQAFLFVYVGVIMHRMKFAFGKDRHTWISAAFIIYALLLYQPINALLGHGYPVTPTFGLPCPTTIFTFAVLLLSTERIPYYLLIIPGLWAFIGSMAALKLGVAADWMLPVSALVSLPLITLKSGRSVAG